MPSPDRHPERDALIYEARLVGRSLAEIAAEDGLSVERVRQIRHVEAVPVRQSVDAERGGAVSAAAMQSGRWSSPSWALLATLLLSACAFQHSIERAPGAPLLPPSASAVAVATPPADGVRLGIVTVQGNNHQSGAGCESQALFEAKKIGATHVVIRPAESSLGRGVKCTGEAYYSRRIPDER